MSESLWELLPAFLREDDADAGALRALLDIVGDDLAAVESAIWDFYDDLFIETCQPWAISYIGALVANDLIYDGSRSTDDRTATTLFADLAPHDLRAPVGVRSRADVGRTIGYRRRKGTPAMLEEVARNVTGWPVKLVECFQLLDWPQHLSHLRPQAALIDVRSPERGERAAGPFSDAVRTVDMRLPHLGITSGSVIAAGAPGVADYVDDPTRVQTTPIEPEEPPYHPRTAAFFAWRLDSSPIVWSKPAPSPSCSFGWSFSPLGSRTPLFSRWVSSGSGDTYQRATEPAVPQPIRRTLFSKDLADYSASDPATRPPYTTFYGPFADPTGLLSELGPTACITVIDQALPLDPTGVFCTRLDTWPAAQPAGRVIGIDVVNGRFVLGTGYTPASDGLAVAWFPGHSGWMGGGGYDRSAWLIPDRPSGFEETPLRLTVGTRPRPAGEPVPDHPDVSDALAHWQSLNPRPACVIEILDSGTYYVPGPIELTNHSWLVIQAANGERPHLRTTTLPAGPPPAVVSTVLEIDVDTTGATSDSDRAASLTFSGVLIEGALHVVGQPRHLRLWHSTIVPGCSLTEDGEPATAKPSIVVEPGNQMLRVEIAFSIVGPVRGPRRCEGVWLLDSAVDGLGADTAPAITGLAGSVTDPVPPAAGDPGPPLHVERSTVLGAVQAVSLDATDSIFTGRVWAQRTQEGCVRFSYVTLDSVTARRYRCQPDLAADAASRAAVAAALASNPSLSQAQQDAIASSTRAAIAAVLVPSFTARRYGHPAYLQLARSAPAEIQRGASDGSEMGALCHRKQPQREDNLRIRLAEYLPFSLDPALVFVDMREVST